MLGNVIRGMMCAKKPTGQPLPKSQFTLNIRPALLAATCLCAVTLAGCSTMKKTADAPQAEPASPASAKGILAKGGATASNLYTDPAVSKAAGQAQAQTAQTAPEPAVVPSGAEGAFPPAPNQPTSMAGLVTQPTGVRAGSGTIFSANPPAPPAEPSASGPVPAELPRRNFNAMASSVYSLQPAAPTAACGTDEQGNPVSC